MSNINCHFGLLPQRTEDWFFRPTGRAQTSYSSPGRVFSRPYPCLARLALRTLLGPGLHSESTDQGMVLAKDAEVLRAVGDRRRGAAALVFLHLHRSTLQRELPAYRALESNLRAHLDIPFRPALLSSSLSIRRAAHIRSCQPASTLAVQ